MKSSSLLSRWLVPLALATGGLAAQAQPDPPARVGSLSHVEGTVVHAPPGQVEWKDAPLNRPVTAGDRLWSDPAARAELHLGTAVLHLDSEAFLEVIDVDQGAFRAELHEGSAQARVRGLGSGELFEVDTPQLAFRALQAGTYRLDVDPTHGRTRVTVREGSAVVYGSGGQALTLRGSQQVEFAGRDLQPATGALAAAPDDRFDRWAAERNRREDQSPAARQFPAVVGAAQLDMHGKWAKDRALGLVWYPNVAADWAPYRFGHWDWIKPWGWTWVDRAAWGFAPFHYGRWALIGSRWAWVPGRLDQRPVYAPALVAFLGTSGQAPLALGSGRGIGWYPLAPGELWRPTFAASGNYLREVNRAIGAPREASIEQAPLAAITAMRSEDFRPGVPVHRRWQRPRAADVARATGSLAPGSAGPAMSAPEGIGRALPPAAPAWPQPMARSDSVSRAPALGGPRGEAEDPRRQWQLDREQQPQRRQSWPQPRPEPWQAPDGGVQFIPLQPRWPG